jgi:hypothetical protein
MKIYDMKKILCDDNLDLDTDSDNENDILDIIKQPKSLQKTPISYNQLHVNYQKLSDIKNIDGFIVNVHDAINFDIDLELPYPVVALYLSVIKNSYIYRDNNCDELISSIYKNTGKYDEEIGTTYRCRLRGIGINKTMTSNRRWKMTQLTIAVKQLINRSDGWVECVLGDIDIYQRLLVDVYVHTITKRINLYDFILEYMIVLNKDGEKTPLFYKYKYRQ